MNGLHLDFNTTSVLSAFILVILVPLFVYKMQKRYDRAYETKIELETERYDNTKKAIDQLIEKLDKFIDRNTEEHDTLFKKSDNVIGRVIAIETVHKVKGCSVYRKGNNGDGDSNEFQY